MKRFLIGGILALGTLGSAASAATTIYECSVSTGKAATYGWIKGPVLIAREDGAAEAKVSDPVTLGVNGKPAVAALKSENSAKVTFGWSLKTKSSSGQNATMNYRASIIASGNKFVITATPLGYANNFRGDGTCKVSRKN